jgi:hypothetical protein
MGMGKFSLLLVAVFVAVALLGAVAPAHAAAPDVQTVNGAGAELLDPPPTPDIDLAGDTVNSAGINVNTMWPYVSIFLLVLSPIVLIGIGMKYARKIGRIFGSS